MKKFLLALMMLGASLSSLADIVTVPIPGAPGLSVTVGTGANALPLQNIQNNPNATNITTWDDNYTNVPLGFSFPYYGQNFTNSWAMTNGMVTFIDPAVSGIYGACCQGVDLTTTTNPAWNYSIFGVHTDLYSWNGANQWYLREADTMTYGWYNISQCCSSAGGNSFEIKITSTGTVDTRIAGALVNWNAVTSGMSGDLTKGEYYQFYHGSGINLPNGASWNTTGGFTGSDPCLTNPLSSPTCPGYAVAYLNQQCSISALYDPSCPGYSAAYFSYQCSANPLYDLACPGYSTAYYNQQCSLDPLYDSGCQGYSQAYYNQQCSLNPLYDSGCNGYSQAYYSQQCSINALYDVGCPGYAVAYLNYQCSVNPLYSTVCEGYQQAYYNQQCSLNALYDRGCPGYSEAYALANVVVTAPEPEPEPVQQVSTTTTNTSSVAVIADPVVNNVVTSTSTTTSPAVAAPVVPLVTAPTTTTTTTTVTTASVESSSTESKTESTESASTESSSTEEKKEAKSESKSESKTESKSSSSNSDKPAAPTARQQIAAQQKAKAMETAVRAGAEAAAKLDSATSMAAQVAVQNVLIQAMGYTPGFSAYSYVMPDGNGYKPFTIYKNQKNVDNRLVEGGLTAKSDRLHQQLIDLQYKE